MPFKVSIFLKVATNVTQVDSPTKRIGGWSEHFIHPNPLNNKVGNDIGTTPLGSLCRARAALLPRSGSVYQERVQAIMPTGASQPFSEVFPGSSGLACDIPQMALIGRARGAGVINTREVSFRGLPDARAIEGEYQPSQAFQAALTQFFRTLSLGGWQFIGRDLGITAVPMISVTAAGLVTTEGNHGILAGAMVRVLRMVNLEGERMTGGRFKVAFPTGTDTLTLVGYDLGEARKGKIRRDALTLVNFENDTPGMKTGVRKVGRPLDLYSGKRRGTTK